MQQGLSAEDDLSYLREFEHITLARVLLAQYRSDRADHPIHEAVGLLARLLHAAEEGERTGSVIEILVVQALAHQAHGDIPAALIPLEHALTLAEPRATSACLWTKAHPWHCCFARLPLAGSCPPIPAGCWQQVRLSNRRSAGESPLPTPLVSQPYIEPLSQRERDVLRLLKTELSGRRSPMRSWSP